MSSELVITNLMKSYGAGMKPAVDNVSFTIEAGNILALLGPSGCGKTTTLRSVAGLDHPTGGTISIGGRIVADPANGIFIAPQHRNLGMVFQSYAVWPHMSVRQNVEYPLRNKKLSRKDIRSQAQEALELVGLQEYADRPVVALSGGQMQRVALARSLSYKPTLLLLDEPLSNLDAKLRIRLRDDLRKIVKDAGVTALYVTHDQAEAVVIGDRIGVMKDGQMLQHDVPTEVYNNPRDLFVANFTGAATVLNVHLRDLVGGSREVYIDGHAERLMVLPADFRVQAGQAQMAIRPENVKMYDHALARRPGLHEARVLHRQYLGTQTLYTLSFFGQIMDIVELGTVPRFTQGENVQIEFPIECLTIFTKQ